LRKKFVPEKLPIMAKYPEITYFGPHKSYNGSINQYVFSTLRKINLPDQNIYLYIETGRNALETLFAPENRKNTSRRLLILNNDEKIAFSENKKVFPENSMFTNSHTDTNSGYEGNYFWNKERSNQGWSIVSLTPVTELNHERNQWLLQIILVFIFFLLVALLFAWLMWKMVYYPLNKFNREVKTLTQTRVAPTELTQIPEFDDLLNQVRSMRTEIWDLYGEIEQKEKRRADLEVEKLLYQINPHFLMNTLDTVHWMAVFSGHEEIDKLVLSLNKLLNYNLGKMGETTNIRKELQAVKEYLELQQVRYDFEFDIDLPDDERTLEFPIPRFILQPLVENALQHGGSYNGYIHVDVKLKDCLMITVQDNGAGMSKEKMDSLLLDDSMQSQKVGMGIGLQYVKRILEAEYGKMATFDIKSEIGKGTIVSLRIPFSGGELTA
jgi:two-component system sensor histidine kinase YesM